MNERSSLREQGQSSTSKSRRRADAWHGIAYEEITLGAQRFDKRIFEQIEMQDRGV